jgi:hypothetical protein
MNVTILVMKDAVLSVKKQLNIHLVNVNVLSETGILEYMQYQMIDVTNECRLHFTEHKSEDNGCFKFIFNVWEYV